MNFFDGLVIGFAAAVALCIGWYHFGLDLWFKRKVRELKDRL